MTLTKMNGKTNVGEVRLAPLDMGFDVKEVDITVHLPDDFGSVGFEKDGDVYLAMGTREELVAELILAGYRIEDTPR